MSRAGVGPTGPAPAAATGPAGRPTRTIGRRARPPQHVAASAYPYWFYLPALVVFGVIFVLPTALSFYFSLTRWTLFDTEFIGLDNFELFLREPSLTNGLRNTIVYAVLTSGLKVIIGLLLATLLTSSVRLRTLLRSIIFFPVLVSTVAVGITFAVLMHPSRGLDQHDPRDDRNRWARVAHRP